MRLLGRYFWVQAGHRWMVAGIVSVFLCSILGWGMQCWPGLLSRGFSDSTLDSEFHSERAALDLQAFVGPAEPRVAGTPEAAAGRDRLVELLTTAGLSVDRQPMRIERRAGGVDLENLLVRVPGRTPGPAQVLVVAHTDSAPGAPGASDDGAGVVAAMGIARALLVDPPQHDVLILLTDGEERGLLGAQAFAANMTQSPLTASLRAVVNMDARGAAGPAFIFETGPQTAWLADLMAERVAAPRTNSLMGVVYGAMPNGTDFTVFLKAGMTGFNIAFIGDVAAYHTPLDTVERQSKYSRDHMGRTGLALVRALDQRLPAGEIPPARAVFGDVLGQFIVRWPEQWTLVMVIASALTVAVVAAWNAVRSTAMRRSEPRAVNRSRAPGKGAAQALLAVFVQLCMIAGIGWGFQLAAQSAGLTMATAGLRLQVLNALLLVASMAVAIGVGAWLARRRIDPWSALLGAWVPWWALAGTAAVLAPAASFLFVVPVVALALATGASIIAGRLVGPGGHGSLDVRPVAFMGLLGAVVIVVPMEPAFVDALGFQFGWLNGVRAALLGVTLVPLVVAAWQRESAAVVIDLQEPHQ